MSSARVSDIINHISQTIRSGSEGYVEPLLSEYPRIMQALLASAVTVERLAPQDRLTALDVCVELLPPVVENLTSASTNGHSFIRSTSESIQRSSRGDPGRPLDEEAKLEFQGIVIMLLQCLKSLVGASNAPVLDYDKSGQVLSTAIIALEARTLEIITSCLELISSLLKTSTLNSGRFMRQAVRRLVPLLRAYWSSKALREELLTILIYMDAYISTMIQSKDEEALDLNLQSLLETMKAEYNPPKATLIREDQLCFRQAGRPAGTILPVGTLAFSLHSEHDHMPSELGASWMTAYFISHYAYALDSHRKLNTVTREDDGEVITKRPRGENHLHEYLRDASNRRNQKAIRSEDNTLSSLQVISFFVQEGPLEDEDLFQVLEILHPLITHDKPSVSAWALVGLTAYVNVPSLILRLDIDPNHV
jgi:ataxia telangiectasia mutated family protein